MATIAVDAVYAVEIDKILEFRLGSLDTLVAPATIVPSRDGDVHDLKEPRGDIAQLVGRLLTPRPLPSRPRWAATGPPS